MPYTSNPFAPKARHQAAKLVLQQRMKPAHVARMYGVHRSTIARWVTRFPKGHHNFHNDFFIFTQSSAPHSHPNQTPQYIVDEIIHLRKLLGRCAPVIHAHLLLQGITLSERTVSRILKRQGLIRKKKQTRFFRSLHPRPKAESPGALIQMDTIHFVRPDGTRFYLYCLIDVYSRLAYAEYHTHLKHTTSLEIIHHAQKYFGFSFTMIQTDHGPEFKDSLTTLLGREKIKLRHSRIKKPNDNAHIERFNRTIQEECFKRLLPNENTVKEDLLRYLAFYNNDRLHLSLNLQTPTQFVAKVLS